MIPRRRKRIPFGTRADAGPLRCPAHLAWIRGHECSVRNDECQGGIEAAHVRTGTDGGLSVKPSDCFTIPACSWHHKWQSDHGEAAFERRYGISMLDIAAKLAALSPALRKMRREG